MPKFGESDTFLYVMFTCSGNIHIKVPKISDTLYYNCALCKCVLVQHYYKKGTR
jgi:hypothetical protein